MVSEMTPEDMDGWIAYDRVVPIGIEKVCWTLAIGFSTLVNAIYLAIRQWFGNKDLKDAKPRDFIPWLKKKKPKDKYLNPNAMVVAVKMAVNR